ncbi:MAG: ABC transporter permease [Planctomycetes bacterium]|nr:ABC transporter permease [Planctomycetota bacterium]
MSDGPRATTRRVSDVGIQVAGMAVLLGAIVVATGSWDPSFWSPVNINAILRDSAILALFAIGQGVVIIAGGIDLSVGSLLCFSGMLALLEVRGGFPLGVVILSAVILTTLVGVLHGVLICGLRLQPFLVTLCSLLIFRGLSRVLTNDRTIGILASQHPSFAAIGRPIAGIPFPVAVLGVVIVAVLAFMHRTVHGRYLYAIGHNLEAARLSGVRVNALRIFAYGLSGFLTGVAGLLEASAVGSRQPTSDGAAYELYGITAAVLGGCALSGGQGSIIGIVVGAGILLVVRSAIIFFDVSQQWTFAVTGLVLLGAVVIDALVRRRRCA